MRVSKFDAHVLETTLLAFMIKSGRNEPTPAIPMPDLAVPYAAPAPVGVSCESPIISGHVSSHVHPKIILKGELLATFNVSVI